MTKDFKGKTAIVTGAASGIGAAIARQLAERGANIVAADLDMDGLKQLVGKIESDGGNAILQRTDVSRPEEVQAMVSMAVETFGRLDLAVNNAGVGGPSANTANTADYPLDGWRTVIHVNLNSVFYCLKYEIAAMTKAGGGGSIVNMASILGSVAFANAPAYVAAKHGVVGLTKTAAIEFAKQAIRINAIGPGFIDTPLLSKNFEQDALTAIAAMHPIGRLGKDEEVAALTCFLLSDAASFITGSYHLVDGGYTAQ
ncbi:SDR family NAD(P)-dependent oxidoreductase [Pelagibacterium montanilacus]|uniref:SDR family NAD(P)-dependent oxidoreductase n=1 Tax=Pelagibacterium montanilacus TaxID=2185280 RepID=UPI000F8F065A|nr:SDR family oxidoreductase [Pelagibacterium montanilacus]